MFCYLLGQLLGILYPICTNRMVYPNLLWWSEWEFPHILRHLNNYLVCSWWHCLRRIRPWVLSGGSMSQSFEVSKKNPLYLDCSLCFLLVAQVCGSSCSCHCVWWSLLCLLSTMMAESSLWNLKPKTNFYFYRLPWSWNFIQ